MRKWAAALLLTLCIPLVASTVSAHSAGRTGDDDPVVARVGRDVITEGQLLREMNRVYTPDPDKDMRRILQRLVEERALAAEAKKSGLLKDPEVIEQLRDGEAALLARLFMTRQAAKITISDEAARKEYDAHPDKFVEPAGFRIAHILLSDQAKATQLVARLRRGEIGFEDAVRTESRDMTTAGQGGDLGWQRPGALNPDLQKAAQALKPGEISDPVKSPFGYHILKLTERRNQARKPFEEVKNTIKTILKQQEIERVRQEYVARAGAKILLPEEPEEKPGLKPKAK